MSCSSLNSRRLVILQILILFSQLEGIFVLGSHIISYGPSIEELTNHKSAFSQQFHDGKGKGGKNRSTIFLSDYSPTLSVLIPLLPGKAYANRTEAVTYFENLRHGEFDVRAPSNFGVIAVIQLLRLSTVYGTTPVKCLDYITFADNDSPDTDDTVHICGEITNEEDAVRQPKKLVGPRVFIAPSGNLTMKLFLVSMLVHSEWTKLNHRPEKQIRVEIAFTAFPLWDTSNDPATNTSTSTSFEGSDDNQVQVFYGCPSSTDGHEMAANNNNNSNSTRLVWRRCSKFVEHSCIHRRLFCDDIVHCGFSKTSSFGQDELHCDDDDDNIIEDGLDGEYYDEDDDDGEWVHGHENSSDSSQSLLGQNKRRHRYKTVFNGTRKVTQKIVDRSKSWEVQLVQAMVIALGLIFFLIFIFWLVVVVRRIYKTKFASFVDDKEGEKARQEACMEIPGVVIPGPEKMTYKQRQSIFQLLKERRDTFAAAQITEHV